MGTDLEFNRRHKRGDRPACFKKGTHLEFKQSPSQFKSRSVPAFIIKVCPRLN